MKGFDTVLKSLAKKGAFHIFGANLVNKSLLFFTSIIVIRILSKNDYGAWAYANNILNLFMLFKSLGTPSGVLQFSSSAENDAERRLYFKQGYLLGFFFNIIVSIALLLFSHMGNLPVAGSIEILKYLWLIPLMLGIFHTIISYKRALLKNRYFSMVNVSHTALHLLFVALMGLFFGIKGIIAGKYIALLLILAFMFFTTREDMPGIKEIKGILKSIEKKFVKYCVTASMTNSLSSALYLLDTFILGLVLKDSIVVASYKVSSSIPFALNVIPASAIMFFYPYFAKLSNNIEKAKKYFYKVQLGLLAINLVITILLFSAAPLVITLLYGNGYSDSILAFRILIVGYFFAGTFRIPAGNFIASQFHVRFNLLVTIFSGVLNILLDLLLISKYGKLGAAIATASIFLVTSVISNVYILFMKQRK